MFGTLRPPYDVAVIDPPWHFQTYSDAGAAKSPQAQYQTMGLDDIAAVPLLPILARRSIVFMWTTWPHLARGDAHFVLAAWGLRGSTGGAWIKREKSGRLVLGTGFIWRGACEPILVAMGPDGPPSDIDGAKVRNVIEAFDGFDFDGVRREHSRKPDAFYRSVEALTPGMRRVDLFARQRRTGWDSWGDELDKYSEQFELFAAE